ncbi:MAG: TetR/AcrR family transcriptional regulator [Pseudomonadota bacterium]
MAQEGPYHHGNLRAALVIAGIDLLEEAGLPGLSLRAVAARVGVSHSAPRNHFRGLAGLLSAIAAEGFRRHAAALGDAMAEAGEDRAARAQAAAEAYVAFALASPALFTLMFSKDRLDADDAALWAARSESYDRLREAARGYASGPAASLPENLAAETYLWSLVHGFARLRLDGVLGKSERMLGRQLEVGEILPKGLFDER